MSNRYRSEQAIEIGGRRLTLRLSLQALAEIESVFEVASIEALGRRLAQGGIGANHLLRLTGALARGAGEGISDADLARLIEAQDIPRVVEAIIAVFGASFPADAPANPPEPHHR